METPDQELADSERVLDAVGDPVYALDADGRVTYCNGATLELLGYAEPSALRGRHARAVVDDDTVERARAVVRELLEDDRRRATVDAVLEGVDGTRIEAETHLTVLSENGRFQGTVGILRAVSDRPGTDRTQRTRELHAERALTESVFDALSEVIYTLDTDWNLRRWNHRLAEVTGYEDGEIADMSALEFVPEAHETAVADAIGAVLETGEAVTVEAALETRDGRAIPHEFSGNAITGEDGELLGLCGVARDITERKARERERARHTSTVRTLHEVATDLVRCETPTAVCERVTTAAEEILSFDLAVTNVRDGDVLEPVALSSALAEDQYYDAVPVDDAETHLAAVYRAGEAAAIDDLRTAPYAPADPEYRSVLTVPIGDQGVFQAAATEVEAFGEADLELAELLVSHARSALARLEREAELRARTDELERQNRRLDAFAGVVSHDLRNPLDLALNGVRDLADGADRAALNDVEAALVRMETLIERTLTLARQGRTVGATERVSVARVAARSWELLATDDADLEIAAVRELAADEERLRQLFENLFRNALQHAGPDVTVTVGDLPDGFYVADDGPGIPPADRAEVFEPEVSRAEEGTGLGLAIVEAIAAAHGWSVGVADAESGGARFEITGVGGD